MVLPNFKENPENTLKLLVANDWHQRATGYNSPCLEHDVEQRELLTYQKEVYALGQ